MRDIALAMILAVLVPLAVRYPWMGVMSWIWVSLMVPHAMTYGFMYGKPVAMLTGGATLLGLIVSKDPKKLPMVMPVVLLILFSLWMVVTYFFSLVPTVENLAQLDKVLKINLFTLVTILVIHTRKQVDILIAVVALSVAFFGVKGGIFTIATGGAFRVRGEGGFLHGNNEIGLGMIMVVPLLYYFVLTQTNRWIKWALWAAIGLTVVATLGTQSRGALLGIVAMSTAFILRSPKRLRLIVPLIVGVTFVLVFMPESWWDRMESIRNYQEDESALGRLNAWTMAFNIATSNFFGGGFYLETDEIFQRYAPNPAFIAVAHSIYFQVLGQHGFIGLFLYLAFWISVIFNCAWVAKHSSNPADIALARMIEISLVGFAFGGAFLNLAYFDGPYYLMAALVIVRYKILNNTAQPRIAPLPVLSGQTSRATRA